MDIVVPCSYYYYYGLLLSSGLLNKMIPYSDVDWASCLDTYRAIPCYCVLWSESHHKHHPIPTISRSSSEAEYRAVTNTVTEASWLHSFLSELGHKLSFVTLVFYDNVSAIFLVSNLFSPFLSIFFSLSSSFSSSLLRLPFSLFSSVSLLFFFSLPKILNTPRKNLQLTGDSFLN